MTSPQLVPGGTTTGKYINTTYISYNLVPKKQSRSFQLYIATAQTQTHDVGTWSLALIESVALISKTTQAENLNWWHSYWDRSYIIINPDAAPTDPGFQVGLIPSVMLKNNTNVIC